MEVNKIYIIFYEVWFLVKFYFSKILNLAGGGVCTCWSYRRTLGDLFSHCPYYSFEAGSLTRPGARLATSKSPESPVSSYHSTGVTGMCLATLHFLHGQFKLRSSRLWGRCPLSQLPRTTFSPPLPESQSCSAALSVDLSGLCGSCSSHGWKDLFCWMFLLFFFLKMWVCSPNYWLVLGKFH